MLSGMVTVSVANTVLTEVARAGLNLPFSLASTVARSTGARAACVAGDERRQAQGPVGDGGRRPAYAAVILVNGWPTPHRILCWHSCVSCCSVHLLEATDPAVRCAR
jgi:hypothetical protein